MRIALFHNLPSGGAKRHTFEQVRELARRGHEVYEFSQSTADLEFMPMDDYLQGKRIFDFNPMPFTLRRIPLITPYIHLAQGMTLLWQLNRQSREIAQAIDASNFDLVFVKDCRLTANPYVLRHLSTPSVFQCHHGLSHRRLDWGHDNTSNSTVARLKNAYYGPVKALHKTVMRRAEIENVRSVSMVLTSSYFVRELIYEHYGVSAYVVYPGVDTQKFRPLDLPRDNYILTVGSLTYQKGYRFMIEALGRVPKPIRPRLLIAANSINPAELQVVTDLATSTGVKMRVETVMDDDRLVRLYNQAQALASTPIMEPLGLVALEAMACGTPVVAVKEGGIRETVLNGTTGFLVDRDEAAFAQAIETILRNPEQRDRMGRNGTEYVRSRWTWHRAVDTLEQRFQQAMNRA